MLVDSHCHLDFPDFGPDLDAVLERAAGAGVGAVQTICTRVTRFDGVRALTETHPSIWCSVGIHPHHVDDEPTPTAAALLRLTDHPKVIGIGETGLDFHYDNSPRPLQEASFRRHIAASRASGLPLIVHTRGADEETCRILLDEAEEGAFPGVIHCFSVGRAVAQVALDLGLYLSFSGILTFKKADALRTIARDAPADRILLETDSPYLAPVPHRGTRNEPARVRLTAERLATLKGTDIEEIARATADNFFRLFTKARPQGTHIT